MPQTPCACSTDRCGCLTAFWWPPLGSRLRRQAPEGPQEDASAALALDLRSFEQTDARSSLGAKLRRDPLKPQEEDGEMQWDYTATQQAFSKSDSACSTLVPPSTGGSAEPPSLDLIYRTMVQNHEQAQRESRKMEAANRQLQLSIKKVVKSCQDIGVRIATMETRTEELEIEVKAATAQTTTHGQQISDIQWKLEDAENCQRRNNLRILGIAEDLEGQDTRAYIASLFKTAFPDLIGMTQGWHIDKIKLIEVLRHPTSCGIKNLYPLLLNAIQDDLALLVKKWGGRVGAKETEVCESMEMARSVLLSAGPQAQHFMVLYNLYYTPAKISSWGKMLGIMCPRCGCPKADLCHMFFQCVKLESLITGIFDILKKILKQAIYLTNQMVVLGVDHSVCNSRDRYFLFIAMSVFRSCIASLWRDVDPPRFNQWLSRLLSMYHLEK
ncbi:hypothetical protein NDU88_007317 [Pleurodeles waltl]|uniref:Reverse transcriptase zinc-binding domain-containing protein n=1 Tax=Pleurodeles waltl TaxID=8319 RepID=A0AAV7SSJ2_PLEWA|nr:hypothetical protein NDU88_007317 [Pleurodeles waltl]